MEYGEKFKMFDRLVERGGPWPQDTCTTFKCQNGGCCQNSNHHLYDVCLHCGNDERHTDHIKFRGR